MNSVHKRKDWSLIVIVAQIRNTANTGKVPWIRRTWPLTIVVRGAAYQSGCTQLHSYVFAFFHEHSLWFCLFVTTRNIPEHLGRSGVWTRGTTREGLFSFYLTNWWVLESSCQRASLRAIYRMPSRICSACDGRGRTRVWNTPDPTYPMPDIYIYTWHSFVSLSSI